MKEGQPLITILVIDYGDAGLTYSLRKLKLDVLCASCYREAIGVVRSIPGIVAIIISPKPDKKMTSQEVAEALQADGFQGLIIHSSELVGRPEQLLERITPSRL